MAGTSAPGPARDAYLAARRAQGPTRETVSHQKTPNGTLAIVVLEGDDVHGVDLANDPPPEIGLIADTHF